VWRPEHHPRVQPGTVGAGGRVRQCGNHHECAEMCRICVNVVRQTDYQQLMSPPHALLEMMLYQSVAMCTPSATLQHCIGLCSRPTNGIALVRPSPRLHHQHTHIHTQCTCSPNHLETSPPPPTHTQPHTHICTQPPPPRAPYLPYDAPPSCDLGPPQLQAGFTGGQPLAGAVTHPAALAYLTQTRSKQANQGPEQQ